MSTTIYATFPTESDVERAVGALLDHGVPATAVSLVAPERLALVSAGAAGVAPPQPAVVVSTPTHAPIPDPVPLTPTAIGDISSVGAVSADPYRPAPADLFDEVDRVVIDHGTMRIQTPEGEIISTPESVPTVPANTPGEVVINDTHPHIVDMHRGRPTAADGISTTTAADAGKGALEGTGIGLGIGLLLGLATVAIPGVGFVAGSGALIAGLTAATGAAGGVAGMVYGYLVDLGVSPEHAQHLTGHLNTGGIILSVSIAGPITEAEIIEMLQKYGATSAQAF